MVSIKKIMTIAALALITFATTVSAGNEREEIGADESFNLAVQAGVSRRDVVSYNRASYVAVHFSEFNLPKGDAVIVRSEDYSVAYEYTGLGRSNLGQSGGFYATFIPGSTAVVEYFSAGQVGSGDNNEYGYKIDKYARGYPMAAHESICGASDNSVPAKCYFNGTTLESELPEAYTRSRSVARLVIQGKYFCTGWLAGSEGHMITNEHCVEKEEDAKMIDIEFDAESPSCADQCKIGNGCSGNVVAQSATFVTNNKTHDYALLKLPEDVDVSAYDYLRLRERGPVLNEFIYVPQHPRGWAKRIAAKVDYYDRRGDLSMIGAYIQTLGGTTGCGSNQVGYTVDTQGGSSGSPVLSQSDNLVVALHHCGGCENTAVDIRDVIADLRSKDIVVQDLIELARTPSPVPTPTPTPTSIPTSTPTPMPTPTPSHKPAPFCNKFSKKWTCNVWGLCKWDAESKQCHRRFFN